VAKNLMLGDLVYHRDNAATFYIVVGFTYRVSRWGNRRLIKLFCATAGKIKMVLEEQLVLVNSVESEKSS
tara:strand:+ start:836 stop:1045 length:210 start_codon:yes stop_codon:yes gene_type:complete